MTDFPAAITAYTPETLCGQGGYGAVWRVRDAVGSYCALKIVYKNSLADWQQEFNGLTAYKSKVSPHPNLIRIFHIENCPDFFWYTMECADNLNKEGPYLPDTLSHRIKHSGPLDPIQLAEIFGQLAAGLEHLHHAGLIHRDIKPENIIFSGGIPKFGDIGLVSLNTLSGNLAGTQCFIPPEYLTGRERKLKQDIDLYALGKTLYCAFSGQEPEQYPLVPAAVLRDPRRRRINQIVKEMCAEDPSRRMSSIPEMIAALREISVQPAVRPSVLGQLSRVFHWIWTILVIALILFLLSWLCVILLVHWRFMKIDSRQDPVPARSVPPVKKKTVQPAAPAALPPKPVSEPAKPKPLPTPVPAKTSRPPASPRKQPAKKPKHKPAGENKVLPKPSPVISPVKRPVSPIPRKEPQMQSAKKLSSRSYREVQEHVCDAILENEFLKPVLPDAGDIFPQDVIIDSFYEHKKSGTVYIFRIPSREIRGRIRISHIGAITIRGLGYFYIKDKKISFSKQK